MEFDINKLKVNFIKPVTPYTPINKRKYILTYSDKINLLSLDITNEYFCDSISNDFRCELIGTWKSYNDSYGLVFCVYIKDYDFFSSLKRYNHLKENLKYLLKVIMYADEKLIYENNKLLKSPIYIKFDSNNYVFDKYEFYGYVRDYYV